MSRDEPYNAADRDDVKAAQKAARQQERDDEDVFRSLMSLNQSRAFMHRFLGKCCIFQGTFTGDALQSAFLEGQRNIGLWVFSEIARLCPDQLVAMMREANDRAIAADVAANNAARAAAKPDDDAPASTAGDPNFVQYPVGSAGATNGTGQAG